MPAPPRNELLKIPSWLRLNLVTKYLWKQIHLCIISGLLLVNFLDPEIIQLTVNRKKFFFDSSFKNKKAWDVFFQFLSDVFFQIKCYSIAVIPEKILRNCQFRSAGGSLKLNFEKRVGYLCSISLKVLKILEGLLYVLLFA